MPEANAHRGIADEASSSKRSRRAFAQRILQDAGIGVAVLLIVSVFSVTAPHFTDESNITNILTQITINLIMATGMTFVILIGGIDLSVGSVMALCAMVAGLVLNRFVPAADVLQGFEHDRASCVKKWPAVRARCSTAYRPSRP